ncbi:hypothetical protein [Tessaracoccus sp. MC1756]|uniref:hypothetical protein n=1 Tax=Tessaracoccus sp. MC1756 TaxID=2760311 RepID=UPI001602D68E|nr:hypothetical protein [Tessaracoccus sp. MC1756]MBB1509799.1 hypothetical protein [Tessaracoccus sp. MC1756]
MVKKFLGAAAAAVLALGGAAVYAPQAQADGSTQPVAVASALDGARTTSYALALPLSPMSEVLCYATRCGISTPIAYGAGAYREGAPMRINVLGQKNRAVQVRAYAAKRTADGKLAAVAISNSVSATPTGPSGDGYGQVRVEVTIGQIPTGYNGGEVIVQTADWTPTLGLVPADSGATDATKVSITQVLSARGRDIGFHEETFTDIFHRRVDAAIPGQRYSVQMLRSGKWVTIDNRGPATVGDLGTASIQAKVPADLPTGKYRTRIVNITRNLTDLTPDAEFAYFTWTLNATPPKPTDPGFNVYTTPGVWDYNGRKWKTSCEAYSATERCRTEIWATQILYQAGQFNRLDGWAFNNLTYKPSPRALWKGNLVGGNGTVGYTGQWTAADGRKWRVECDTATSGRNGCRAYAMAKVAEPVSAGATTYRVVDKWLFNNIVQFN